MAVTCILRYLSSTIILIGITSACDLICNATVVQNRIECEPLECPTDYVLDQGLGKCGYCSACVRYAQLNEPCTGDSSVESNVEPNKDRYIIADVCDKGLRCNTVCEVDGTYVDDKSCYDKKIELAKFDSKLDWVWNPNCDSSAAGYKPVQCKGQRCYCTQKDGTRIFGHGKTEDGAEDTMNCECSLMEVDLSTKSKTDYDHVACQTNGNFKPLQCLRNLCFCVNETTAEVVGPVLPMTLVDRLPCYEKDTYEKSFQTLCQMQRGHEENLAHYYYTKGYLDPLDFIKCDPDGSFLAKQCNDKSCYCGKPDTGEPIDPNGMNPVQGTEQLDMNCHCLRDNNERGQVSMQLSPCKQNGNYEPVRCVGSVCYCLDSDGHQRSVKKDIEDSWKDACVSKPHDPDYEEVRECYRKLHDTDCTPRKPDSTNR